MTVAILQLSTWNGLRSAQLAEHRNGIAEVRYSIISVSDFFFFVNHLSVVQKRINSAASHVKYNVLSNALNSSVFFA